MAAMKALVATRLGGPEVLELQELPDPAPAPGEVLIEVVRAAINFADLLSIRGQYAAAPQPPFVPGLEVSGRDAATGKPVVAIVRTGGFAQKVVADRRFVFDAEGLDLELAAGWPLVTVTAHYALAEIARLRPEETLLIPAAAGGLGTACVQLAKALGSQRIVAMASTPEKRG